MPTIQQIQQSSPLLIFSPRERSDTIAPPKFAPTGRGTSARPVLRDPIDRSPDRYRRYSLLWTLTLDLGRFRDVSSFLDNYLYFIKKGGKRKNPENKKSLKKNFDAANLRSPRVILKIRLRNSPCESKGEILKKPCARRATFRSMQASSGDCRFFQRSVCLCLWPVPSPSPRPSRIDYAQFTDLCYYSTVFHPLRPVHAPAASGWSLSFFFKFRAFSKPEGEFDGTAN